MEAKIDAYIKENPEYWACVQAMPRDRLERTVVLNEVRQIDGYDPKVKALVTQEGDIHQTVRPISGIKTSGEAN